MIFTINEALNKLLPNVEWKITDNDLSTLEIFTEGFANPTKKQIEDTIKDLQNEHDLAQQNKAAEKAALLAKLGITEDEAKLLLG